jgi:hypothetical protein
MEMLGSRSKSRSSGRTIFTDQSSRFVNRLPDWKMTGIRMISSYKYRISVIAFNILSISQFILLLYLMDKRAFLEY